jgi:TolA-binding protein
MFGRGSVASTWLLASLLGIASAAFAQQPADGQPPAAQQDAPAAAPAAADPELANQVQQLQAEVDQLKAQVAQLNSVVEQLQSERATVQTVPTAPTAPTAEKGTAKKSVKKGSASSPKATPPPAPAPAAVAPEETTPTTVLVFHDGHRTEARNYAIVGQTLWIYTQDESQKVPLSELDVAATKSANSDRGIIFQMPASR